MTNNVGKFDQRIKSKAFRRKWDSRDSTDDLDLIYQKAIMLLDNGFARNFGLSTVTAKRIDFTPSEDHEVVGSRVASTLLHDRSDIACIISSM